MSGTRGVERTCVDVERLCKARKFFRRLTGRSRSHPRDGSDSPRRAYMNNSPMGSGARRAHRLCEHDRKVVREILKIFWPSRAPTDEEKLRIKDLLDSLYEDGDIAREIDDIGLNIIQWCVIWNCDVLLSEVLATRAYWHNINAYPCNSPLHLACKFGHIEMVRVLLEYGADVNLKSTACYPMRGLHTISHSQHYGRRALCFIHGQYQPISMAFRRDHVEVVKELLMNKASRDRIDTTCIIHEACKVDSKRCIEYLITEFPDKINERQHGSGESALGVALRNSEACAEILLELGTALDEDIVQDCTGKKESVLHALYSSSSGISVHSLTRLIAENHDLPTLLGLRDREGNTPLHVLSRNVGRRIQDRDKQKHRDQETYQCINFLMDKGADTQILNNRCESVLHILFEDNCSRNLYGVGVGNPGDVLEEVNKVLEIMLKKTKHLDLNLRSEHVSPVINRVIRILCSMGPYQIVSFGAKVHQSMSLLCKYGADPSIPDEKGIYILTRVLTAANRWLNQCADEPELVTALLRSTQELMVLIFQHGSPLPPEVLRLSVKQVAIMTNIHFVESGIVLELSHLMEHVFNGGFDPDFLGRLRDGLRRDDGSTKPEDITYFLARMFVFNRSGKVAMSFFTHIISNMSQVAMNNLKTAMCHLLRSEFAQTHGEQSAQIVEMHVRTPRSLFCLSRVAVNSALRWNLRKLVPALPLPSEIKQRLYCS